MQNVISGFRMKAPQISTQQIILSRLISKAVTREADGSVTIVAVFELSTYYQFFHIFKAASPRTPRKKWKYTFQYHGIHRGHKTDFHTLKTFTSTGTRAGKAWTIRHAHGARALRDLQDRISQPLKGHIVPQAMHRIQENIYSQSRGTK